MEQNKKISLREEVEKEAKRIDQEISGKHKFDDIKVSKNLDKKLFEQIQEYEKKRAEKRNNSNSINDFSEEFAPELNIASDYDLDEILSEEDKEALRLGRELVQKQKEEVHLHEVNKEYHKHLNKDISRNERKHKGVKTKVFHMPRKKRLILALSAVLILVVGTGITSVGSKSYIKEIWNKVLGIQPMQIMSVKDMETKETVDGDVLTAIKKVSDKLNIATIQFGYVPDGMALDRLEISEEQKSAYLFYIYNDEIVRFAIYLNDADSLIVQRSEEDFIGEFNVKTQKQTIMVEEFNTQGKGDNRFKANFSVQGVNYQLKGVMKKEEFIKILKNIIYLK
jgi:hypothetical protein